VAFVSLFAARRSVRSSRSEVFLGHPDRGFDLKLESPHSSLSWMIDLVAKRGKSSRTIISGTEYPEQRRVHTAALWAGVVSFPRDFG
jgi:hypothetical protein